MAVVKVGLDYTNPYLNPFKEFQVCIVQYALLVHKHMYKAYKAKNMLLCFL